MAEKRGKAGMKETDREVLIWLHERLEHVHKEDCLFDYMHRLRAIISSTQKDRYTPNDGRGCNSLKELFEKEVRNGMDQRQGEQNGYKPL